MRQFLKTNILNWDYFEILIKVLFKYQLNQSGEPGVKIKLKIIGGSFYQFARLRILGPIMTEISHLANTDQSDGKCLNFQRKTQSAVVWAKK